MDNNDENVAPYGNIFGNYVSLEEEQERGRKIAANACLKVERDTAASAQQLSTEYELKQKCLNLEFFTLVQQTGPPSR
jgi:hypothetical protein